MNPPRLIVNADDYGYFDHVCQGILDCAHAGTVTATGVLANGPVLSRWADALLKCETLDVGVHLNATSGPAMTEACRRALHATNGVFPSKGGLAAAVLRGSIPLAVIEEEWRAQIEKCRSFGFRLTFLNSHEHVHMLPPLFRVAQRLAREFGIRYLRWTRPEWDFREGAGSLLRSAALGVAGTLAGAESGVSQPVFLGLAPSGRIHLSYVRRAFGKLRADVVYELMCHPGRAPAAGIVEPRLLRYHDWEGERALLCAPEFAAEAARRGIRLIGFGHLDREQEKQPSHGRRHA